MSNTHIQKECYLCGASSLFVRKNRLRDMDGVRVAECGSCGLVQLEDFDHITAAFYEESGMHGNSPESMQSWLNETDWDDQRRYDNFKGLITNKNILDFGCGAGGFLKKAQITAKNCVGVEVERRVLDYWSNDLKLVSSIEEAAKLASNGYDVITAFHVLEHLQDPKKCLRELSALLAKNGQLIIEVPSADDALLTLYDCMPFKDFTYWSQHLYLFTASTLQLLAKQVGLKTIAVEHYQRYPLANHLYWLSNGRPAGHHNWTFLKDPALDAAYSKVLAAIGKTDTLLAILEK